MLIMIISSVQLRYGFCYELLPEHIKYFPCPPNNFISTIPTRTHHQVFSPVLQVHFSTYNAYQNTSSILPCPPSPFLDVQILPEHVQYFFILSFKQLSSPPSSFPTYRSYQNTSSIFPVLQAFFPLLQVLSLRTNPTRTDQVFFALLQVFFSVLQIFFLRTNPTRTHQVFCPVL